MSANSTIHNPTSLNLSDKIAHFNKIAPLLYITAKKVEKKKISSYPLFILTKQNIALGTLLIEKKLPQHPWHYYATYVELLIQSKWILDEKEIKFKQKYKNPAQYCCILMHIPPLNHFVYLPYTDYHKNYFNLT